MYGLLAGTEMESRKKPKSDAQLFLEAMSGVQPLKPGDRHPQERRARPPVPSQSRRDEEQVLRELLDPVSDPADLETGEELIYLRPGHSPRLLQRMRRGHYSVADSIDLHHMDEKTAREVLARFLVDVLRRGLGCVRIVHGKGLRSRSEPVLKRITGHVLRKHPAVIAFASCRPIDGGTGAVVVLLKQTTASSL